MENLLRIIKLILRAIMIVVLLAISVVIGLFVYVNIPVGESAQRPELGVTFSVKYAQDIGLDWKAAYIAMLDDLNVKRIRIPVYWDIVQPQEGEYDFSAIDWQLDEAEKRDAEAILVLGQKVPRWPECHIPQWAAGDDQKRKAALLDFIAVTAKRYKDSPSVSFWQIENEPFLKFGICPALDISLLDREIAVVKAIDPIRKIIITDSGELSLWIQAASRADVFGTTMYRTIFKDGWGYFDYPIGPRFFQVKHLLNKYVANQENAIVIELQGEPWIKGWTTSAALSEQFKSMNSLRLSENVRFAEKVGFPEVYLWGVEWWYWLKATQGHPELWDEAKILFQSDSVV